MLHLPSEISDALGSVNEYQLRALRVLADELRREACAKIKPPMTLDQYGATVGATAVLTSFIAEIERAMG